MNFYTKKISNISNNFKYLTYKIINALSWMLIRPNRIAPCLFYTNIKYRLTINNTYCISLISKNTHLGDKLFFFPLINFFHKKNIKYFVDSDELTREIFYEIYGYYFISAIDTLDNINIYPKWDFLKNLNSLSNSVFINFLDYECSAPIASQLVNSFAILFGIDQLDKLNIPSSFTQKTNVATENKIIIYSNYVNSGSFRLSDNTQAILKHLLSQHLSLNKLAYHVGSKDDKNNDKYPDQNYDQFFVDTRGALSIIELIRLYKSGKVLFTISYDNFWMHISNIFNTPCYIVFRGRYVKKNVIHHFKFINNAFELPGSSNITYLEKKNKT